MPNTHIFNWQAQFFNLPTVCASTQDAQWKIFNGKPAPNIYVWYPFCVHVVSMGCTCDAWYFHNPSNAFILQEALTNFLQKILPILGSFLTDTEVKVSPKMILTNTILNIYICIRAFPQLRQWHLIYRNYQGIQSLQ